MGLLADSPVDPQPTSAPCRQVLTPKLISPSVPIPLEVGAPISVIPEPSRLGSPTSLSRECGVSGWPN